MNNYGTDYDGWRQHFIKINWLLYLIIVSIEFVMFLVLKNTNMINESIPYYLKRYFFFPVLINGVITVTGHLISLYAGKAEVRNGAPVVALTCMLGVVSMVHCVFFITMLLYCIPVFCTAFFGNRKLTNIITALSIGFLLFLPVYCYLESETSWTHTYFLPSVGISIVIIICCQNISKYLIDIVNQQNEQLVEKTQEAIRANEAKSKFLSMASHEIRTPMNAVVGMTELLLQEDLTEKQRKYLENIRSSGSSLVMIVNDILDESKIEAGKMDIVEEAYQLENILDDIRLIIENRIGEKPVELVYEIDPAVPKRLVGDSLRIRQILINLMNNAVKFTEKGEITLTIQLVEVQEESVLLRFGVRDTGLGIRQEDLERLFQAFSQVDTKKNHHKEGTGLGLSIASSFVSLMGGQLEVASEYGRGSEFFFTIGQMLVTEEEAQVVTLQNFTAPNAKVLCVDDTPVNLIVLKGLLGSVGVVPDLANSGQKAIEKIKQNRYDLVFMDYMMPDMDGVETTEHIRALAEDENLDNTLDKEYYRTLPIIALTGATADSTREQFRMAGIDDFAEKPMAGDRMKELMLKWLPEHLIEPDES